ncbi:hypothetical protein JR316_0003791 [Psilocybe cubensis]|uniref:Uncharacterized protein n=2 Tax=Psilocybe cubensis TaxID=181762 RepID=A0A8H7Y2Q3_PSICU|nr:hypothetical protein JR316_0003791 [Psilocybe cubensis]KAH9484310.1 hypothetical protein JR316_0003791 [Psilocybe cubensis]
MGRTAQDFETHGVQSMRKYLRSFTLPDPPTCAHYDLINLPPVTTKSKSHQNQALRVQPEDYRTLECIRFIFQSKENILSWLNENIPGKLPKSKLEETKKKIENIRYILPDKLSERFFSQRMSDISHLPDSIDWELCEGDTRSPLFRYQVWKKGPFNKPRIYIPNTPSPIVIAYQTPYVLSPGDFEEFVNCKSFPSFMKGPRPNAPFSGKFKLWATLWDACRVEDAMWFFLTTYTHWAVGQFTEGGGVAFISSVFHYKNRSPTLLEWLTYWMATAMKAPDTKVLPRVYEPITESLAFEIDSDKPFSAGRARSESYWPGRDDEPGTQAITSDYIIEQWEEEVAITEGGNSLGLPAKNNIDMKRPDIVEWMSSCMNPKYRKLDQDDLDCPVDLDAEWAEHEMFVPGAPRGEWMIST